MKEKILIYGASGHAKVVIDIIEKQGIFTVEFLVDDDPVLKGKNFFGYRIIGGKADLLATTDAPGKGIVAIGSNVARRKVSAWLVEQGIERITAVHPSAQISRGVKIGNGTVIMAGVSINADTVIGDDVIVNTRASVDHDCCIADYVHLAPGSTLCGAVSVGTGTLVAAGATVIPNLTIGENVIVGAGAVVIRDVPDSVVVVGNPAKVNRR